jgi:hypothetical protein
MKGPRVKRSGSRRFLGFSGVRGLGDGRRTVWRGQLGVWGSCGIDGQAVSVGLT